MMFLFKVGAREDGCRLVWFGLVLGLRMMLCGYCFIHIVGFDVIGLLVGWLIIYCYYVLLFFPELIIVRCFYGDRFYCS